MHRLFSGYAIEVVISDDLFMGYVRLFVIDAIVAVGVVVGVRIFAIFLVLHLEI